MVTRFTDTYMRHKGGWVSRCMQFIYPYAAGQFSGTGSNRLIPGNPGGYKQIDGYQPTTKYNSARTMLIIHGMCCVFPITMSNACIDWHELHAFMMAYVIPSWLCIETDDNRFQTTFHRFLFMDNHIDGLAHDCSNSTANAMELLQSCTKTSI